MIAVRALPVGPAYGGSPMTAKQFFNALAKGETDVLAILLDILAASP